MTNEQPRLAKLQAACCSKEIIRFDLPSRTPGLLTEDAIRNGWTQDEDGAWGCDQHPAGPELFPSAHLFRRYYLHVEPESSRIGLWCADCTEEPQAKLKWRTPRAVSPLLNLGEMAEMAFRHELEHHRTAAAPAN